IFIEEGAIVHADYGALVGEVALYGLLALRGGEFNLIVFSEPPHRTISGSWEFLLMESARLSDERAQTGSEAEPTPAAETGAQARALGESGGAEAGARIAEIVLCSGAGEALYEWECKSLERRLRLLEQVEQQAEQLSGLVPVGRFDRL